ncbi:hypothetical protein K435DRAFT_936418 [Dendrothele bispora CBS 962.96]|uniref:Sodium/calcium exchanger membrane region domain-containing protein n=1 Tax=Dendrothele bispora (strain CBS 962.96) TaxID=1314807 RepID=A0A4S8KZI8_DENBC|nr:hypothetical protein K435DRAFT_936418 [Dendrothele bispora CBS 962.96]
MAVASIFAQLSVFINTTFGSIIEPLLYALMLTQGKGRLVEGSLVESIPASVLLIPGLNMVNARSAPDPVDDPFYQFTVESLIYFCAAILAFSYHVDLWCSLRTHASQIWQNPRRVLQPQDLPLYHQISLSETMTQDNFTRAVAVATVSALRHQQHVSPARMRAVSAAEVDGHGGGHGGHDAPSWSRLTSASVLLAYAALCKHYVLLSLVLDVVDVILSGSGLDEKFLGVTLFAAVPNATEFTNAILFALNGSIALSMEISSVYALQVCLLQTHAMVAFSARYAPERMHRVAYTPWLIFPRWEVVVIILSMSMLSYTHAEARSNYRRGSIQLSGAFPSPLSTVIPLTVCVQLPRPHFWIPLYSAE